MSNMRAKQTSPQQTIPVPSQSAGLTVTIICELYIIWK